MSPDADDGSPSPEPEDQTQVMAVDKLESGSSEGKSPKRSSPSTAITSSKANAKDPSRPRRKKARRACYACQRAHLTCGDERPCLRCIKRGLQEQCQDGVRKKAKYLHDAPAEALIPGFASNYNIQNGTHSMPTLTPSVATNGLSGGQSGTYFPGSAANPFPQHYATVNQQSGQMGPPVLETTNTIDFSAPHNVETPSHYPQSVSSQQTSPLQEMNQGVDSANPASSSTGGGNFDSSFFDPNDPSLYNFNISDLNFGNHYGALEFGMLGHMSGAVGTPDHERMNSMSQSGMSFDGSGFNQAFNYGQQFNGWQNGHNAGSRHGSTANIWASHHNSTDAYAIGEQPPSLAGQSPRSQDFTMFNMSTDGIYNQPEQSRDPQDLLKQSISQAQQQQRKQSAFPGALGPYQVRKRRQTSAIYSSVTTPYSHTKGFHALTAYLQTRFSSGKVLRIAKALASIRPSFISCNQYLDNDDLIHAEKSFQRTLSEYDDFLNAYGVPTVIFRRTGEVVNASKEFSLITGWRKDVLLGNEPNLNVNVTTGDNAFFNSSSGGQTGASTRGAVTPHMPHADIAPGRPQAVFIAELMDEDSVVEFYEDFSERAFEASNTNVIGKPCTLLKYRTKEDPGWSSKDRSADEGERDSKPNGPGKSSHVPRDQNGTHAPGDKDAGVKCMMCWTMKRDTFDMPMMIVINTDVYSHRALIHQLLPPPFTIMSHRPETTGPDSGPEPPFPLKLSGKVIKGFGRGSSELGIPTANIPLSGLSVGGHEDVDSGVYYGWAGLSGSGSATSTTKASSKYKLMGREIFDGLATAMIGGEDTGHRPGAVYPMVMSIGWNPFYKNTVRSVEVHLMHQFEEDFYGSHMNVLILGFIRPELDYVSKEKLIEDIKTDIDVAGRSLARKAYAKMKGDGYLLDFEGVTDVAS
nr:transcription activator of gluconeogenesis [Quercus suber]